MSSFEIIAEYNDWARRGYVQPMHCPRHPNLDLIADADKYGVVLVCGLCDYMMSVGLATEKEIHSKVKMARFLFAREA